jgi:hypothetical protein
MDGVLLTKAQPLGQVLTSRVLVMWEPVSENTVSQGLARPSEPA